MNACLMSVIASATFTINYPSNTTQLNFKPIYPQTCAGEVAMVPVNIMIRPENSQMCFAVWLNQNGREVLSQEYEPMNSPEEGFIVAPFILDGEFDALNYQAPLSGTISLCQGGLPLKEGSVSGEVDITGYGTITSIMHP